LAAGIALYDEYHATLPEISPDTTISDISLALPFVVRNKSNFFSITNAHLSCEWDYPTWQGNGAFRLRMRGNSGPAFSSKSPDDTGITIAPGEAVNFVCDFSKHARAAYENGVPLMPVSVRLRINVTYQTAPLPWDRTYLSPQFNWEKADAGFRWLEGPTIQ
jgi:hypothetical protein